MKKLLFPLMLFLLLSSHAAPASEGNSHSLLDRIPGVRTAKKIIFAGTLMLLLTPVQTSISQSCLGSSSFECQQLRRAQESGEGWKIRSAEMEVLEKQSREVKGLDVLFRKSKEELESLKKAMHNAGNKEAEAIIGYVLEQKKN